MKYLGLLLIFISLQGYAQITGNFQVRDSSALALDAATVQKLMGKWKLLRSIENFRDQEPRNQDRGYLVEFTQKGTLVASWCEDCHEEEAGRWEVQQEMLIQVTDVPQEYKSLGGSWVVYKLTDEEMILVKVFTSSGDWKKRLYFTRNMANPDLSETSKYCLNCDFGGAWCWGDRPEKARQQWAMVNDLINNDDAGHQQAPEIITHLDWLLSHAPCINENLYIVATRYYESLLAREKQALTKNNYQEKLKSIKAQQQHYFKNGSRQQ